MNLSEKYKAMTRLAVAQESGKQLLCKTPDGWAEDRLNELHGLALDPASWHIATQAEFDERDEP